MSDFKQIESLFENAPIGIFETTIDGKFVDLNNEFVSILGYESKEDVFNSINKLETDLYWHPNDRVDVLEKLTTNRGISVFEKRFKKKNGSPIDVRMSTRRHKNQASGLVNNIGLIEDITEAKRNARLRAIHDQRYRLLFESSNDAILIFKGLTIIDWNQKAIEMFALTDSSSRIFDFKDFSPLSQPDGASSVTKAKYYIEKTLGGVPQFFEWEHITSTGKRFCTEVSLVMIPDGTNSLFQAIVRDISDRKEAERFIKESEYRYRKMIDSAPEGIVTLGIDGVLQSANPAFISMVLYDEDDLRGKFFFDLPGIQIHDTMNAKKMFERIQNADFIEPFVLEWISKDGNKKIFEVKTIVFKDSLNNRIIQVMFHDMTVHMAMVEEMRSMHEDLFQHKMGLEETVQERTKEIQTLNEELESTNEKLVLQNECLNETLAELKMAQAHLIHSEKMSSIGVLTAGIAHEINNPVNYINSGTIAFELLLEDLLKLFEANHNQLPNFEEHIVNEILAIRKEMVQLLSTMKMGIQRTSEIVGSLRSFSRVNDDKHVPVDLKSVIESTLVILRHKFVNRIELHEQYASSNTIIGNRGQLAQLVMNVLLNAIQAIKETGKIEIKTSDFGESLVLSVNDNGCGIAENVKMKIFDPFFTTKPVGEGTGLGLSIVHGIVTSHKGKIHIESEKGEGTTVSIQLPKNYE